jgi:calcineurin-like phosphoesterase family protein
MSNVRFIGCLHLGHEWIAKYRGFNNSMEHDKHLILKWNEVVNKKDLVYILGDITMETPEYYPLLNNLKGRKKIILGNHDLPKDVPLLLNYVDSVCGMMHYKKGLLTHAPIHPSEISFYDWNIHAHIHHVNNIHECKVPYRYGENLDLIDPQPTKHKYINVDALLVDYQPKTLKELNLI